jgi:hypothetical protein
MDTTSSMSKLKNRIIHTHTWTVDIRQLRMYVVKHKLEMLEV